VDGSLLITVLIWLLVGLGALAIALGVMVFAARRMGVNGGHDGEDEDLPRRPHRPPRGENAVPLRLSPHKLHGLHLADFHNDERALRDFGELVTVAALAADGWNKLPSRLQGEQGLDLLFVRPAGEAGYEAVAIEVKTNSGAYNPETMSDERVAAALGRLHDAGAFDGAMLEELLRGLWQGPPYFRKELWRHQLDKGETLIFELDEAGRKIGSEKGDTLHLMDALFQVIKQFDRKADYVDRPVVEAPPEETVHAGAGSLTRRTKRKHQETFLQAYARAWSFPPKRRSTRR
jgi:hypothetical protein